MRTGAQRSTTPHGRAAPLAIPPACATISGMISLTLLAVAALAVARVTRLITTDYLTDPPRSWAVRRLGADSKLAYLLVCRWCMSMWVASVAALLLWAFGPVPWLTWPAVALAMSQVTGMLSRGDE